MNIFDKWDAEDAVIDGPTQSTFYRWYVKPAAEARANALFDKWDAEEAAASAEPGEAGKSEEPSFIDNLKMTPAEGLKGWVRGSLGIPESAGTAIEYAGRRLETTPAEQLQNGINRLNPNQQAEIINTMIDRSRPGVDQDASFNRAAKQVIEKYAPLSALRGAAMDAGNAIAPSMIDAGRATADYYKDIAADYKADKSFAEKNLWDNPELLLNPAWWASSTMEMMPQLMASLVPGAAVQSAVVRTGAGLIPQTAASAARLVKLGRYVGAATGGLAGGGMEAAQTYRDVLDKTGNEKEAARAAEFMGVAASILNTVGNAEILEYAGKSFLKKVGRGFVVEGTTEAAEEPADVSGRLLSKIINGEDLPDDIANLYIDSLKSALTVFPVAGLTGGGGAAVSFMGQKKDLLAKKAADTDLAAQLRALTRDDGPASDGTISLDTPAPPGGFGFPAHDQVSMDAMERDILRQRATALAGGPAADMASPLQRSNQEEIDRITAEEQAMEREKIRQAQLAHGIGPRSGEVPGHGVDNARQAQELLHRAGGLPIPEQNAGRLALPFPESIDPKAIALPYDDSVYDSIFDQWDAEDSGRMEAPEGAKTAIPFDKRPVAPPEPQPSPTTQAVDKNIEDIDDIVLQNDIQKAVKKAATSPENDLPEPTQAQKEAGNYQKAHIKVQGLDISIENPDGTTRSGTAPDGKQWETTMHGHYGYFKSTKGKDGDQVDVFVGLNPKKSSPVFIVDQVAPETGKFDEHKVIMGVETEQEARDLYLSNYEQGWQGLGAITQMHVLPFKKWLSSGKTKSPVGDISKVPKMGALTREGGDANAQKKQGQAETRPESITGDLEGNRAGNEPAKETITVSRIENGTLHRVEVTAQEAAEELHGNEITTRRLKDMLGCL